MSGLQRGDIVKTKDGKSDGEILSAYEDGYYGVRLYTPFSRHKSVIVRVSGENLVFVAHTEDLRIRKENAIQSALQRARDAEAELDRLRAAKAWDKAEAQEIIFKARVIDFYRESVREAVKK